MVTSNSTSRSTTTQNSLKHSWTGCSSATSVDQREASHLSLADLIDVCVSDNRIRALPQFIYSWKRCKNQEICGEFAGKNPVVKMRSGRNTMTPWRFTASSFD